MVSEVLKIKIRVRVKNPNLDQFLLINRIVRN